MSTTARNLTLLVVALIAMVPHLRADERRAPAPKFSAGQTRGVFFNDLNEAFRGPRPTLSSIRKSSDAAAASTATADTPAVEAGEDTWSPLISPMSLEDEIKRMRLHYDSVVTTPGAFNSGGYQEARLDLTVLATLFAVVHEHRGEVRWKDQAAAARDLLARTAFNCKAGSTQVYNEAKLRKADLQDLLSGSGLSKRDAEPENDWSMIADRSPLMEYAEKLIDALEDASRDAGSVKRETDLIKRNSELLSMFGEVLTREGLDEADDEDYTGLSRRMMEESKKVTAAIERGDADAVRMGVSAIRQKCDACHEQYR
jgi:cytochrome c556